jgi:multidrug efflux pump subunit AcrB
LSLIAAAVIMRYRGGSLDTMVLAGLVIALGEVVDDAIIDVENIIVGYASTPRRVTALGVRRRAGCVSKCAVQWSTPA